MFPSGASGYDYQWQENDGGWFDLTNEITDTYSPGVNPVGTHEFRLEVTSSHNSNCISKYTNPITITVLPEFTAQFITQDQDICYNTLASQLEVNANGADNIFTYQWYNKTNGNQYAPINNANSDTYDETIELIDSTLYMVEITSTFGCGILTQSDLAVNVADTFQGNPQALNTVDTICYNTIPDLIQTNSGPEGGYTDYTYEWQYNDGTIWQPALNSITDSYQANELTTTTFFRVTYTSANGCGSYTSDSSEVTVLPILDPGSIKDNDTICYGGIAQTLIIDSPAFGANNDYTYQWQEWNGVWQNIQDSTGMSYSPGSLIASQSYRLGVKSTNDNNCYERYTDSIHIHVWDSLDPGSISQNQTICYNTNASDILNTLAQGVDNDFSYVWYQSSDGFNFTEILNASDSFLQIFDPLTDSTYYTLDVTSDFGCGTQRTNSVLIAVYDEFTIGDISGDLDPICHNETLDNPIVFSYASGADGVHDYAWQWSYNNDPHTLIPGAANASTYSAPILTDSVSIQLMVSNSECEDTLFTNYFDIIVNPRPNYYAIESPSGLTPCANQSNVIYTLETTPSNYRYVWSTVAGQIFGTNQSLNCMITWPDDPGINVDLEVTVSILETGCDTSYEASITLSSNSATNVVDVILKPNSTILACNDSTLGIQYQWGFDLIATGVSTDLIGETLQYVQLSSVPDTNINRYWVDTYFNNPAGISCITRSYYNEPPAPLDINEINFNNFSIYPNPATDVLFFNFDSENEFNLKVIDLLGRSIDCIIDYENKSIRFKGINPSIYMLLVESNGKEFIKKFIIK